MDTKICVHSSGNQIQPSSVAVSTPQLRKLSADRELIRVLALLVRLFCGIVTKPLLTNVTASSTLIHCAVDGAPALPVTLDFEIRVFIAW